jgi:hypothetical protein
MDTKSTRKRRKSRKGIDYEEDLLLSSQMEEDEDYEE